MILQNLHTHTVFDDGSDTHEAMLQAAVDLGFTALGFSYHSVLPFENDWAVQPENLPAYFDALEDARRAFADRIRVYSGIEWDVLSDPAGREKLDYVIGSIHHITVGGAHYCIDESFEKSKGILEDVFGGDPAAMSEAYFAQYERIAEDPEVDIVGHLDVVSKFCDGGDLLDVNAPYFTGPALEAAKLLIAKDKIFELNTGAVCRGKKKDPYPSPLLLKEMNKLGARMTVSSDCHQRNLLNGCFAEAEELLKASGFTEVWELTDAGFRPRQL